MKRTNKLIERVYREIDKIALGGRDNILEYKKLIDALIRSSDYDNLIQCLNIYYEINAENYTVTDVKRKTYDIILMHTKNSFQRRIERLYKAKNVYQQGYIIYSGATNLVLGEIHEILYTINDFPYYVKDHEYAEIVKERKNYLDVYKEGVDGVNSIKDDNQESSEQENLYNRYVKAINFLLN